MPASTTKCKIHRCSLMGLPYFHEQTELTQTPKMTPKDSSCDLLIIGAGPAGLMAACWAAKFDMETRIIDNKRGPTPTGHADGIQSRTLEILESFDCVESIIQQGVEDVGLSYWVCPGDQRQQRKLIADEK